MALEKNKSDNFWHVTFEKFDILLDYIKKCTYRKTVTTNKR